ncbi:hypothetical protein QR680_002640 [Steinernema hermaphroditum]|uniref:t-SNARE coiled-coil homology domain-containing protein n=1 Tax=Steinernema hermaphroditum TaxID=289476 RepID=A0AA39H3G4_9BILA|nr:hypothetical protein QR680_002640 [Steinernema hermaphroditum]
MMNITLQHSAADTKMSTLTCRSRNIEIRTYEIYCTECFAATVVTQLQDGVWGNNSLPTCCGSGSNEHHGFMEEQNNQMADQLSSKVSVLKRITIAIGDDVREQNRFLNEVESDFDSSKSLLGSTMRKLTSVYRAGGKSLMLYVILFCFFVFFARHLARH